jgi:predicted RNA binding protein YcfA (HicA-like mRNA interferase family)
MKYKDFIAELLKRGCRLHRSNGKHIIYRHSQLSRNLIITKAKNVSPGLYHQCDKLLTSIGF